MQVIISVLFWEGLSACPSEAILFTCSSNSQNIVTAPSCRVVCSQQSTDVNRQCKTMVSLHDSGLWDSVLPSQADKENKTPQHHKIRTVP